VRGGKEGWVGKERDGWEGEGGMRNTEITIAATNPNPEPYTMPP